jgi:hypothetical protein
MEPDESIFGWLRLLDACLTKLSGLARLFTMPKKQLVL